MYRTEKYLVDVSKSKGLQEFRTGDSLEVKTISYQWRKCELCGEIVDILRCFELRNSRSKKAIVCGGRCVWRCTEVLETMGYPTQIVYPPHYASFAERSNQCRPSAVVGDTSGRLRRFAKWSLTFDRFDVASQDDRLSSLSSFFVARIVAEIVADFVALNPYFSITYNDPDGSRTRVAAVKGLCPRPLDDRAAVNSGGTCIIETVANTVRILATRGPVRIRAPIGDLFNFGD